MHQSGRWSIFVQQQCIEFGHAGVGGPGSSEPDMGGKYFQGQYRVSIFDVSFLPACSFGERVADVPYSESSLLSLRSSASFSLPRFLVGTKSTTITAPTEKLNLSPHAQSLKSPSRSSSSPPFSYSYPSCGNTQRPWEQVRSLKT